jgi:hypothetical protein
MPGQIKIDDGAGNYTILTNAGSLGSDKTITIPNETGTLALTSDSFGKVLQVVSTLENTQESTTSTTYADLISASITPASASNKILVIFQDNVWLNRNSTNVGGVIQIVAGASAIADSEVDMQYVDDGASVNRALIGSLNQHYVHSPSTTSAITYKIQWKAYSGTTFYSSFQNQAKHLILMEIEG